MYRVIILPKALEDLSKLDKAVAQRVSDKLTWLSEVIEGIPSLSLKGKFSGFNKLKVGDWRVIYEVNRDEKVVTVHKVGHRREIYK
ncbi:MAG: type II toxin-antitoxin system RelE/ParE family toxin [Thermodesulfovibrionales bacterium]|nr:type II toxin-antitoxin system RelE/ParE family toxin [Thermodesulfovibrionales bacterium]